MEKIFSPAIHLINKLNYARKFLLLGLIYLIAVSFVVYNLYSHLGNSIRRSEKQLQGIALIQPIVQTIQLMQEHRGLELAVLSGNEAMRADHQTKEQQVNNALTKLNQQWLSDATLSQDWQRIINHWQNLEKKQYSLSTDDNFAAHIALIDKLQQFEISIADKYYLNSNSDIALHYLLDTAINKLPMALEQLGQMRAFGSSILTKKQLTENERIKLFSLIVEFNSAFKSLNINLKKTVHYNDIVKTNLLTASIDIDLAAKQLIDLVKDDILTNHFYTPPNDYFKTATGTINKGYYQLNKNLFPSIELLLKYRIETSKTEILINITIALLSLLFAFYIFICIYYTIVHNVKTLARSAKQFANGDFKERAELISDDELSQIVNSFNEMADSFGIVLEKQQDSEQRLQAIINSALDAVIQMNQQGLITGWNKQAEVIFGWRKEEILGLELTTIIPPRYHDAHNSGLQNYLKTGKAMICHSMVELYGLHRLGHEFPVEISLSPIKTKQGIEFNAFIRDITERKHARTVLQESEMRFRQILQDIPTVAVQSYDENGIIHYWNNASEHFYGYTAEEAIGCNITELLILPEGRNMFNHNMRQIFLTKQLIPAEELTCVHKEGHEVDVYCSYAYVHIPDKSPEIFCLDIDLTELKHSEAILQEKEQLLQEAQEVANLGYYITDLKTNAWKTSPVLNRIFGIDENFNITIDNWLNLIVPEYREEMRTNFQQAIMEPNKYNSAIYKIIRPNDGQARWVLASGRVEIDEDNDTLRMVGTVLDITEKKAIEDELQILSLAVQQSPNSIVITDIDANIQFVNKAFTKITGYSF
ncbi:partial Sensor protein FixL, partial [Patescibacteria group bacterium]